MKRAIVLIVPPRARKSGCLASRALSCAACVLLVSCHATYYAEGDDAPGQDIAPEILDATETGGDPSLEQGSERPDIPAVDPLQPESPDLAPEAVDLPADVPVEVPSDLSPDYCEGVTCSGHGTCYVDGGGAVACNCETGYHAEGLGCVPDGGTPCEGVECSGHGTCRVDPFMGFAECVCDPGYVGFMLGCIEEAIYGCRGDDGFLNHRGTRRCGADDTIIEVCRDADGDGRNEWAWGVDCNPGTTCSAGCLNAPCPQQPCPIDTGCVTEAHGEPLNVCVVGCDCSNCGNCDAGDSWPSMSKQCGNDSGPATITCNAPCFYAGWGCIPWGAATTWGICWGLEGCMSAPYD